MLVNLCLKKNEPLEILSFQWLTFKLRNTSHYAIYSPPHAQKLPLIAHPV